MPESDYYEPLADWLEKKGFYTGGKISYSGGELRRYTNTGTRKLRVDVAGIRNAGNEYLDQIETIAIEVRDTPKTMLRDIQDAWGYSSAVNLCYLATTAPVKDEMMNYARSLGVGIIEIQGPNEFVETLQAQHKEPDPIIKTEFLHSLWIVQCTICKCFVFKFTTIGGLEGKSYLELTRARQFDYDLYRRTNWNPAFTHLEQGNLPEEFKMTRFVCRQCAMDLTTTIPDWVESFSHRNKNQRK